MQASESSVIFTSDPSEASQISQGFPVALFEGHSGSPVTVNDRRPRSHSFQIHNLNMDMNTFFTSIDARTPTQHITPLGGIASYSQNIYDAYPTYNHTFINSCVTEDSGPTNYSHSGGSQEVPLINLSPSGQGQYTTHSQVSVPQQAPIYLGSRSFTDIGHSTSSALIASNIPPQFALSAVSPTLSATSDEPSPASHGSFSPLPPTAVQDAMGLNIYARGHLEPGLVPAHPSETFPSPSPAHNPNVPPFDQENTLLTDTSYTSSPSRPCAWGNPSSPCRTFVSGSAKGLRAHLKEAHRFSLSGKETVPCQWNGCNRTMQRENVVRHILSHHLRLKVRCPSCGKNLCRRDVETMHSKKFCPARR